MTAFARQLLLFVAGLLACAPVVAAPKTEIPHTALTALPAVADLIVSHHSTGIAIYGFDPVAYFDKSRPVPGKAEHELLHRGVIWRFASKANREAFARNPDDYVPLFGGYDPVAVSQGRALAGSPDHFTVLNGRLILFYSIIARNQFISAPQLLDEAMARWSTVETQLVH